jgi:hypothetical protein
VRIWRITATKHTDTVFSGIGGLYTSGRWHPQGYKISYTSESLALASLEVFVHSESTAIPLSCVSAIVPDNTPILEIEDLPANWQDVDAYSVLQKIGLDTLGITEKCALTNGSHFGSLKKLCRILENNVAPFIFLSQKI